MGDYECELRRHEYQITYFAQPGDHYYGRPTTTYLPGNGLLAGRVNALELANNAIDMDTWLKGIGTCDMTGTRPVTRDTQPDLRYLQTLDIYQRCPTVIPDPLIVERNQRSGLMN